MALQTPLVNSPYPPLDEVRSNLKVRWYRCEMAPEKFKELMRPSDGQAWIQAGGHLVMYTFSGFLVYTAWKYSMWSCMMLALFVHGTIGSCFLFGTHELAHGTVFQTKWLNKVFLYTYSVLSWWDPFDYAMSHTYHHRYTQFPDGDRENLFPLNPTLGLLFRIQIFTLNLTSQPGRVFGKGGLLLHVYLFIRAACDLAPGAWEVESHEWLMAVHKDQPEEVRKVVLWSRFMLLFHSFVLVASAYTRQWILVVIISFGTFIGNWLRVFMGATQHCGLMSNCPDFRKNTRTITLHPLLEFLYWHMNWHIEHHMFAQVPCYNLGSLHKEVAHDMPEPRTLLGAWKEMASIFERQQKEPGFEFDTPIPAAGNDRLAKIPVSEEVISIGDLAPIGLK